MRYVFQIIFFILLFSTSSSISSMELEPQICEPNRINSGLDAIFSLYENLSEEVNQCQSLEIEPRLLKRENEPDNSLDLGSISGCVKEFIKSAIQEIVATGEGAYEAIKFILKSVIGSVQAYYQFLRTVWFSGVSTAVTELLQNGAEIFDRVYDFFKNLPKMIYDLAVSEVTEFNCLNNEGKLEYVCRSLGVIGPELAIGILTGGAGLISRGGRLAANFVRDSLGAVGRSNRIAARIPDFPNFTSRIAGGIEDLPIGAGARFSDDALKALTRDVQIGRHPKLARHLEQAQSKILKLDEILTAKRKEYEEFLRGPNRANRAMKEKLQAELRKITDDVTSASRRFGELNTKKTLAELVDSGKIEILERTDNLHLKNKSVRDGYPEFNEGGVGYRIRLKDDLQICRGGNVGEGFGSNSPGAYFNPCKTRKYDTQLDNANLNATAGNTFNVFTRFEFKKGAELDLAAVAPVYSSDGLGGDYRYLYKGKRGSDGKAQSARGLGGNVQFVNPDKKNVVPERIRSVFVLNSPRARDLQSDVRRLIQNNDREGLNRMRSSIDQTRRRYDNVEYEVLYEEIDHFLEDRPFDFQRICDTTEKCN